MNYPELPSDAPSSASWQRGLELLHKPAWPLCNMAVLLYLTGPYDRFHQLIEDLPEELEVASITYQAPAKILTNFLKFLKIFETLKHPKSENENCEKKGASPPQHTSDIVILSGDQPADPFDAATARAKHNIIDTELESINSLLCSPCRCTLCCTGPEADAVHDFFEIPLSAEETGLFHLSIIDSQESRQTNPYAENPLKVDKKPFYSLNPAIYHWESGWSMILTRGSKCPALSNEGACDIYQSRPAVCRKPQIFSGILERSSGNIYRLENRLIAVNDCPYVRALKDDIAQYTSLSEADLIFRENKT